MLRTLINVCWVMTNGIIGSAYQLGEEGQSFITASHLFQNRMVERASIHCPLNQKQGREMTYWIHDLGHDVAIVSQDKTTPVVFASVHHEIPRACYHWTLLPETQWPWSRWDSARDLLTTMKKIQQRTQGVQTQATSFYAQHLLREYISEVHDADHFMDALWPTISQTELNYGATEYLPSRLTQDGHRLVLMKSEVRSYLRLDGNLWTDCDGWKGASGGVVVDGNGRVLAITTGLGSEASYFLREKSRVGILHHRYLFAGDS